MKDLKGEGLGELNSSALKLNAVKHLFEEVLKIPISKIEIKPRQIYVFLNEKKIGVIKYYWDMSGWPSFDFTDVAVKKMDWVHVVTCCESEIKGVLKKLYPGRFDDRNIIIGKFGTVHILEQGGKIREARCVYINNKWEVQVSEKVSINTIRNLLMN